MVSAVDWFPTLAGLIGESPRVPTDRPIDGINVADHLLGKSAKSGREAVLYFGLDGRLMSVKWKNFKVIFRKSNSINDPITDVQVPIVHNLPNDPGEHWNLWETSLGHGRGAATCDRADRAVQPERREVSQRQDGRGIQRLSEKLSSIAMTGRVAQEGVADGKRSPTSASVKGAKNYVSPNFLFPPNA